LLTFTCIQYINMGPYSRWVQQSFKQTLLDNCDEYLKTTDRGNGKSRSKLITKVANDILAIAADKAALPTDLEKVLNLKLCCWYLLMSLFSVSVTGLQTMLLEMRRRRGPESRSRIHEAIQHQQGHGRPSRFVAISCRRKFLRSRNCFPEAEKKISESIMPHLQISFPSSMKKT
jgi:hypothetical protein